MPINTDYYHIGTTDLLIYTPDLLVYYLIDCQQRNQKPVINFLFESACCKTIGLYKLLDFFCKIYNYSPENITIITANLVEQHDRYSIVRELDDWGEITKIQKWAVNNSIGWTTHPQKHFGSFIGRSSWDRLWIAAILKKYYADKSLQTFHTGLNHNYCVNPQDGVDILGLDDLNTFNCDELPAVINFIQQCPLIISNDDILEITNQQTVVPNTNQGCYPIYHPSNLAVLKYYPNIFVDIVNESRVSGDNFFLSEKTWRPIVARRPFILMAPRDSIANLKKLGFKTFENFWSEDYDGYPCQDRLKQIITILNTISTWSQQELHEKLQQMKPILDHNYKIFMSLTNNKIKLTYDC